MDQHTLAPRRVVFFGDSRADWWRPLPQLPGVQCLSRGLPGASSAYVLQRFHALVAPLRPDIVVVQAGVNDLVELTLGHRERMQVVAATRRSIEAVVARARDLGAGVILTTIFPLARGPLPDTVVQRAIAELNRDLLGLAAADVQVLDSVAVLAGPDGYVRDAYADDELHLGAAGYAALNAALAPLLGNGIRASADT
ncbi:MAG: SGNH/GDSL hydrolase family protein [Chloroflexales bacterium]|nr:SGNH/GDSL hydrolase family protein [Chloroflexales bacterium]